MRIVLLQTVRIVTAAKGLMSCVALGGIDQVWHVFLYLLLTGLEGAVYTFIE